MEKIKMISYTLRIGDNERRGWEIAASKMAADTGKPISLATFVRIIMNDYCDEKGIEL